MYFLFKNTYSYDLGKTEAVSNPWQFAGGYLDATTGLYKFGTRYYSPTLGRWTQKDPVGGSVGKVGSGNAYVYAENAPVMMTDPSGACSLSSADIWTLVDYGVASLGVIIAIAGYALSETGVGLVIGIIGLGIAISSFWRATMGVPQLARDCPELAEAAAEIASLIPLPIG